MAFGRLGVIATLLLSAPLIAPVAAQPADWMSPLRLAQNQPPMTPQEKERREKEQKKAQEKAQEKAPQPPPKAQLAPKAPPAPPKAQLAPKAGAQGEALHKEEEKARAGQHKEGAGTPPESKDHAKGTPGQPLPGQHLPAQPSAGLPPAGQPPAGQPPAAHAPAQPLPSQALPGRPLPGQPAPKTPTAMQKAPFAGQQGIAPPANRPQQPHFQLPQAAGSAPHLDELQKARKSHVEDGGRRTVIEEPGNRTIIRQDNRIVIRHDDGERFRVLGGASVRTERRPDGLVETFFVRPDGVRVVSVVDANGRLVRRYRHERDGREINIIDNRRFWATGAAIGAGALALGVLLTLPPPVVTLPPEQYIVAYNRASDDDLYGALSADPIMPLERAYSLEEIRENYALRQRLRRINLDTINFEFGSWQVSELQYPNLERIANVMLRLLDRNPEEVFLIAAFTDAVGSDVDNLSLSDRRAEAVAEILSASFGVPPENLVTQGYGAQFLLIDTPGPEVRNRRVEIQRITPLMAER